jgi:N-acetylglucosaminyl-diphospho-decaprenol L-rhamnosyltransferase
MLPLDQSKLSSVTIIVVTYNSAHCFTDLRTLLNHCPNLIISDNASADNSANQAKLLWPQAIVLEHSKNIGFGAANNKALEKVKTPFAFLLNPDCELSLSQLLDLLHAADQFPEAAILAPQLLNERNSPEVNYRWPSTYWISKGVGASAPTCVGFICGAAMLLRMEKFILTGFFDEKFFLYYEDDDLCLRLFEARLPMVIIPSILVVHKSRGSVKGPNPLRNEFLRGFHHARSKLTFTSKNIGVKEAKDLRCQLVWQTLLALPFRIIIFSPKLIARMWGRLMGVLF